MQGRYLRMICGRCNNRRPPAGPLLQPLTLDNAAQRHIPRWCKDREQQKATHNSCQAGMTYSEKATHMKMSACRLWPPSLAVACVCCRVVPAAKLSRAVNGSQKPAIARHMQVQVQPG